MRRLALAIVVCSAGLPAVAQDRPLELMPRAERETAAAAPAPSREPRPAAAAGLSYADELKARALQALAPGRQRDPELAYRLLLPAAQSGDAEAMLLVAELYRTGEGVDPNPREAERLALAAAAEKPVDAAFLLGEIYAGAGQLNNLTKARIAYLAAAEAGQAVAMVRLAALLAGGSGDGRDERGAESWLIRALPSQPFMAGEVLGDLYLAPGELHDPAKAAAAFRAAADAGNAVAMVRLAGLLMPGGGATTDLAQAEALLRSALEAGPTPAAWRALGELYLLPGPLQSRSRAVRAFGEAVEGDDGPAMIHLADLLREGGDGVERDLERARSLLEQAVALGSVRDANVALGRLLSAEGPIRDAVAAVAAFWAATQAGDPRAMVELGRMAAAGDGTPQDYPKAIFLMNNAIAAGETRTGNRALGDVYLARAGAGDPALAVAAYRAAADAGDPAGMVSLARLLAFDARVDQSPDEAKTRLQAALAAEPSAETLVLLGDLYLIHGTAFASGEEAATAFRRAAGLGAGEAMLRLGRLYREGTAVPTDLAEARRWLELALAAGLEKEAGERLGSLILDHPEIGQPSEARGYYETAARAGSLRSTLMVARLAGRGFQDRSELRAMVDAYVVAAGLMESRTIAIEMMRLPTAELVSAVQQMLVDSGERVPIDGAHGPRTIRAIAAFCEGRGLADCETQFVTIELIQALLTARG